MPPLAINFFDGSMHFSHQLEETNEWTNYPWRFFTFGTFWATLEPHCPCSLQKTQSLRFFRADELIKTRRQVFFLIDPSSLKRICRSQNALKGKLRGAFASALITIEYVHQLNGVSVVVPPVKPSRIRNPILGGTTQKEHEHFVAAAFLSLPWEMQGRSTCCCP